MLIAFEQFGRLRLSKFRSDAVLAQLENWEFQEHLWVGEAIGFSEWLRLDRDREVLRSLAIDLSEFPAEAAQAVFQELRLPVRAGMTLPELSSIFGSPVAEHHFVPDRATYEYLTAEPKRYRVSCTVLNDGGLTYMVVMVPPIGGEA